MSNNINFTINDYSKDFLNSKEAQVKKALEECGLIAEGHAQMYLTEKGAVDTGNLRNSVTHKTVVNSDEHSVYIGTNVEYAPYVEYGTVKMKERSYLRPALSNHGDEYKNIIQKELET